MSNLADNPLSKLQNNCDNWSERKCDVCYKALWNSIFFNKLISTQLTTVGCKFHRKPNDSDFSRWDGHHFRQRWKLG
jgi:hypothetical protein